MTHLEQDARKPHTGAMVQASTHFWLCRKIKVTFVTKSFLVDVSERKSTGIRFQIHLKKKKTGNLREIV